MSKPSANLERFSGLAETYDAYRPAAPAVIVAILTQLAQVARPQLVVDIGSGTGLSTRLWAERAQSVIGVEPNADMRQQAEAATRAANVTYRDATSAQTGLPNGCADIVTVSQALHWMEPTATFAEAHRILRVGGVFAAYDYQQPPTIQWELSGVIGEMFQKLTRVMEAQARRGLLSENQRWPKSEHLQRMQASGLFRHVEEILLHHQEMGDARRLIGLYQSNSSVRAALQFASEGDIGLDVLRQEAARILGDEPQPWYWSYRVRMGIK